MESLFDVYAISGRIKNYIANEDIALSSNGTILVNMITHLLKELYDYSETLPESYKRDLKAILTQKEKLPLQILQVTTEGSEPSLYDRVMEDSKSTQYASVKEALEYYKAVY